MGESLLQTKLYAPPIRANFVPRPRLIERLNAGLNGKLTLISAHTVFRLAYKPDGTQITSTGLSVKIWDA